MSLLFSPQAVRNWPRVTQVFEDGLQRGLHFGLQLWIALRGEVLLDAAWGTAEPDVPLTTAHHLFWLSAGKPLTAVLMAQAWERGLVDLEDPVFKHIPEFRGGGKDQVTIRHLLTHTAGMRQVDPGWPDVDCSETIARLAAAELDAGAIPGVTAGYHVSSTWFLLAEILQRVTDEPWQQLLQEQLLQPCGMVETRFARSQAEMDSDRSPLAPMWERQPTGLKRLDWETSGRTRRPSPGSSAMGPIRELGLFYQMLQRGGLGESGRVLQPETVAAMVQRHRVDQFDQTFGHKVDFGLGFLIDSNRYGASTVPYGYGRFCSESTFGHGGAQSSQGYCDPVRELCVAYVFNGRAGEPQHNRRCRQLNEAIYEDLGFAGG